MSRLKRLHHLEINNSLSTKRSKSESGCSEIGSGTEGCSAVSGVALEGAVQAKSKWTNRQRVLIICSRGASYRTRHLMQDFRNLMPHSKSDNKMDKRKSLVLINEVAEIANCSKCLYFENRKHTDVYLWISNIAIGPSAKFLVHNVHTMDELRMSGNCLKGSRPVLSFDCVFDSQPHLTLIKQLLVQTFSTPDHHPRSKPFVDHVFTFSLTLDGKIWFRNFQIVDETLELQEIGPRMVLEVIRIFAGSFEGPVLYDNPNYISPNAIRREIKKKHSDKYVVKKLAEKGRQVKLVEQAAMKLPDPVGEVFDTEHAVKDVRAKEIKRIIERKRKRVRKKPKNRTAES